MAKVILIHGINNQGNSGARIKRDWMHALASGAYAGGNQLPSDLDVFAAFYGDILQEETISWGEGSASQTPMSADSPPEDYLESVADLYREYQAHFNLSDAQVAAELDPEDSAGLRTTPMAKGVHKKWIKAIAKALEKILPSRGKGIARIFLAQAAAYLHKPGLKERIDDIVREQVFEDVREDEKVLVIGHSLGTVIAYSLLRRLRHSIGVQLLITAGSPLGIDIVKRRLGPPLVCLPNVEAWLNASDREDFVALKPRLTGKTFGCDQVVNLDDFENGDADAHSIIEYLSDPRIAEEVVTALDRLTDIHD